MNRKRITELNCGYNLDDGGYSFENPPKGLKGLACVVWEDPDPDTVPWCTGDDSRSSRHDFYGLSCPLYAFAPNSGHFAATEWPKSYKTNDGMMVLIRDGRLSSSDRDCHCHGKLEEWTGAAGEPDKPIGQTKHIRWLSLGLVNAKHYTGTKPKFFWEFTGDSSDKPHPDCKRCDGTGYVTSDGGEWALYALKEETDAVV